MAPGRSGGIEPLKKYTERLITLLGPERYAEWNGAHFAPYEPKYQAVRHGRWKLVRHVVLPLSLPVLLSAVIFSINGTLKVFDTIVALTNGGPGSATTPLTLYMFRTSFAYGEYGYGSTVAFMLTILSLLVTVFVFRSMRGDVTK